MPCFAPLEILLIATAQIIFCITIDLHRESFCLADDVRYLHDYGLPHIVSAYVNRCGDFLVQY